jgi:hypothetical protein
MKPSIVLLLACWLIATLCGGFQLARASASVKPGWSVALRADLLAMADELNRTVVPWDVPDRVFDVDAFGAVPDGNAVNTLAIRRAIDACAAAGGGVVRFSRGEYVTGTIDLKSGVMLEVQREAKLLGSTDLADYPARVAKRKTVMDSNMAMNQSLIFAEGVERIGIRGEGVIDFRGTKENFPGKQTVGKTPGRPFGIRVLDSRSIVLQGITLRDSACWLQNYLNCENLLIDGITVDNQANWNNDGLDIDGCRNVIVRNSFINAEDDALCFKGASLKPTENVLVENCRIYSTCNAVKFGTDSQGDFRRVLIRNIEIGGPSREMRAIHRRRASSGVTLTAVDGGTVEDIVVTGVRIDRADSPLFLRIGNRGRVLPGMPKPPPGKLRRIVIENVVGEDNGRRGSFFSGIAERRIEDVLLSDIRLQSAGGVGERRRSADVPENAGGYPDAHQFGATMPAFGLWIRHADRVRLDRASFTTVRPDVRPAILADPRTSSVIRDGDGVQVDEVP